MLTVGDRLPSFCLQATVSRDPGKEFSEITDQTYSGKWLVLFAWPLDFTFVCPTEIAEFGRKAREFQGRGAQVLGLSLDSQFVHLAWRNQHPELRELPFPMLADVKRDLCQALGILHREAGVPLRATFLVDPKGTIRYACAHDLDTGRNVDEVLRTLDALQVGGLTPCNWKKGEKTLQV